MFLCKDIGLKNLANRDCEELIHCCHDTKVRTTQQGWRSADAVDLVFEWKTIVWKDNCSGINISEKSIDFVQYTRVHTGE